MESVLLCWTFLTRQQYEILNLYFEKLRVVRLYSSRQNQKSKVLHHIFIISDKLFMKTETALLSFFLEELCCRCCWWWCCCCLILLFFAIKYGVFQEERSIFWEVLVSLIVIKKNIVKHVSESAWLLSLSCLNLQIQCVPLATEPSISLIILIPMKILNRSTFVVWEMKRNVSVVHLIVATRSSSGKIINEMPGSVAIGTPYI
jgi:hypothetical protein